MKKVPVIVLVLAICLGGVSGIARADHARSSFSWPPQTADLPNFPTMAQQGGGARGRVVREHDRARDAYQAGEIVPFSRVRATVVARFGGRVIDADLDRSGSPWVYEVTALTPEGRVIDVRVNASTGQIMSVRGQR